MTDQHIETLIIGAGQAGLATGYHLQRLGRPFLVVDAMERVGDNWRRQWDTLRLFTPAKYDSLPGLPFPAPKWHYPGKDEAAAYLERYALHFDLPIRMSTRVHRLAPRSGGGYVADLGTDRITCDNVVVATGSFGRTPRIPEAARELDPSIRQLHSSEYRRTDQLQPGPVLVVGASHSGMDVAFDVAEEHPTILCGRDCGQFPGDIDSPVAHVVWPVLAFVFRHVVTRRNPLGRHAMDEVRTHGGPAIRVKAKDLEVRGVRRITARVGGVSDGRPLLDDGTVADVTNVIWCTGFRQAFDWIDLPVFGDDGWPVELRGVVAGAPGLYFCGLSFQFAFSSMMWLGAGRDAAHVAGRIAEGAADLHRQAA
ncbi:MAG TPA: NAD(P)-binding domain-containing protein [Nocardioides sp.]|uniref:flavin-containing monooxygenase n=1 Tax=Nocardioides sp. TaxID=35761 RepID=UPI002E374F55|nr:NAD(P)-binding domain-containing protein [Nocardioides sp.]HEX5086707.1 NAD(P)-binding domain-containing protein [Nocardioides sp.]